MSQTRKQLAKGYHVMKRGRPVDQTRVNKYIEHLTVLKKNPKSISRNLSKKRYY